MSSRIQTCRLRLLRLVASGLDRHKRRSLQPVRDNSTVRFCRLRSRSIHSDPVREGQRESEADLDATPDEVDQWRALLGLLATGTADPDDRYFGLWDGWAFSGSARRWPTFGVPRGNELPARSYFLFHGPLWEAEIWGGGVPADAGIWDRPEFSRGGAPAFVWPSDHTWCIAADIDPHWAGIGASVPLIELLIGDPRLDAVEADPTAKQPFYR
jgi:hypothetical protein